MAKNLVVDGRLDGTLGLVRLSGEARLELVDALRQRARALLEEGAKHLVVSVPSLSFADSASIGVILELQRDAEAHGGRLVISGPSARLRRQLEGMGLAERLPMAPDDTAARALLR